MRERMEQVLERLLDGIADQIVRSFVVRVQPSTAVPTTPTVRMCPAPRCRKPGAGPYNRYFCKEHARSLSKIQQDEYLSRRREPQRPETPSARSLALRGRKLNMRCRVSHCFHKSRGPRFGYICDEHRQKLSARQQEAAREEWKKRHVTIKLQKAA